ncbi:protein phosphatase PTC1 [Acrasis kona]|uniref:Protein phosphatase PTC1 n=1 Tax=Acrasis kona TaxID=1008807 RepID=A0AAW2ZI91_9EUKA
MFTSKSEGISDFIDDTPDTEPAPEHQQNGDYTKLPSRPLKSIKDIGFCEEMNGRYRRTMEDGHCMIDAFRDDKDSGYFAIYDGHGGKNAVLQVQKTFHTIFESHLKETSNISEAYEKAYAEMDEALKTKEALYNGTTSISCYLCKQGSERKLYTANCGDARVVINEGGIAKRLTFDHKASEQSEVKRIQDKGGFVTFNRVNGILSVTRAFGDHAMKEWVISTPYQTEVTLTNAHTHLILACDGVWDVLTDQEAVDLIKSESMTAQEMSQKLLKTSLQKGSMDNISVMVVLL